MIYMTSIKGKPQKSEFESMTKRESSVEEGGSILQMLAVKGSRREELHGNYKNTEKKKSFYCGRLFSSVVLWNGVSRGWQGGGEGEWKVGYGKKKSEYD